MSKKSKSLLLAVLVFASAVLSGCNDGVLKDVGNGIRVACGTVVKCK